jgi:hypothetical protein
MIINNASLLSMDVDVGKVSKRLIQQQIFSSEGNDVCANLTILKDLFSWRSKIVHQK